MNLTSDIINGIIIFIILMLQLVGTVAAVVMDPNLGKKRRTVMLALLGLATLLVWQNYAEYILVEYISAPKWRTFVAATGYTLRPAIIALSVYMIEPERKHGWVWIPVGVNGLLYHTAYFTSFVFTIDDANRWGGGPLCNLCLIVSLILLAYHIFVGIQAFRHERKIEALTPLVFTGIIVTGIILDVVKNYRIQHWVDYVTISTVACCVFYYLWLHFIFARRYQEATLAEQRFKTMISQLQPHFLYNTLAAISVIDGMPEKAEKAILDFSQYLRRNLEIMTSSSLVNLDKELEFVKKYIDLEKIRFGEKVNVEFYIKYDDFCVPTLSVQMLVENAVKHGITQKDGGGTVWISSDREGENYVVTVRDDGVGFDAEGAIARGHFGLRSVRERLEYTVGGSLTVTSEKGKGTTAKITVPVGKERVS